MWYELDGNYNVLIYSQFGIKVKIFDIDSHKLYKGVDMMLLNRTLALIRLQGVCLYQMDSLSCPSHSKSGFASFGFVKSD